MSVYGEFFTKFLAPFFEGLKDIVVSFFAGLGRMFNIMNYIQVISDYKNDMKGIGLIILIVSILFLLAILGIIVFLIVRAVRVYLRYRRNLRKEDLLIEEIENLNNDIIKLKAQNMKLSELTNENGEIEYDENGNIVNALKEGESRFFKLTNVDKKYEDFTPEPINNNFSLESFCETFRNFSASKLGLY
ncbi:MAG: DUF4381 domain-containing protein, partial [Bacilli bacterium]|nr:DUF4381 domain-containing protein [Bacilli bacterium]